MTACITVGLLPLQLYRQSTAAQVFRAEAVVARACNLIRDRYGADWLAGMLPEVVARVEMELIRHALAACAGNRIRAAEQLGIRRQLLYQKLERYGLGVSPNGTVDVPEADSLAASP